MSTISSQNPTTVVTIATPGPRGPQGPPSPAGDISGSLELTGSLIASGSFVDFSGATYVTGSFTGSYTGSFVGDGSGITGPNLSPYAVLTGSNQFSGSNHFTGSLIPEASGSGGGIYDLGSASKPWKDLYLSTSSLNFVKEGNIISSINGEEKGIRIGNIFIGTGSISVVSGSGDNMSVVANVIGAVIGESGSVDKVLEQYITSSGAAILTGSLLVSGSGVSGSFSGSFEGDGSGLTNIDPSVLPSGTVSSSAQTIANLPSGTISSSEQLPSGIVSGSTQITDLGFINNTITSSMSVLNAETSSIANSLKTGLDLVVNQITGSTASFISMSVGYLETITGSAKIIGDAFIILNNNTPTSRFAGLKVIDSGSVNTTSSFEYDGLNDNWFYEREESGTAKHGVSLFGPEYSIKGTPTYLTTNTIPKSQGNHNLVDSNLIDNGSEVKISTATTISGSVIISGSTVRILADNSYNAVHITGGLDISRDLAVKDDLTVYDDTNLRKDVNIGYRGDNPGFGYSLAVTQSTNESGSAKFEGTVLVEGKVSASLFEGDGSLLTNVGVDPSTLPSGTVSSSAQTIANLPSGVVSGSEQLPSGLVSSSAQTIANLPSGTISSSTQLPSGIVSGSTQISDLGFVTSDITSSTIITSSANLNTITFTKGDSSTFTITLDTGSDAPLPSGVISSSAQVKDSLPSGVISGSEQLPSGIISSSTQLPSGIVSSSTQTISNLPSGTVSGSSQVLFSGISGIPSGIISGSEQLPSGLVSSSTQTIANLPSGTVSSSAQTIDNLPSGIISGSEQLPLGLVSSSAQTISNLPSGTISGSEQLPSGIISGSEQLPSGIVSSSAQTISNLVGSTILSGSISTLLPSGVVSSSAQTIENLPTGTISSSEQLPSGIISGSEQLPSGLVSSSTQVKESLPSGVISGSEQLPAGIISSSVQIIDNLPSGTVSGSEQVLFSGISGVPSGIVSSSAQTISNFPSGVISGSEQLPSGLVSSSTQTIANLPSGTVSSSAQTIENLPTGTISSSEQLPAGIISGSEQLPSGLVSSSTQTIANFPSGVISGSEQLPSGIISGSEQLPSGIVSSSTQTIANLPSGTVSGSIQIDLASTTGTASWATNSTHTDAISITSFQSDTNFKHIPIARTVGTDGTFSIDANIQWRGNPDTLRVVGNIEATSFTGSLSYNDLDEVPSGIISGSTQLPSGIVSSSSQTIANLPSGTISSSTQLPSGIISGSEQLPSGIVSSSSQTIANLPSGTISSSTQLPAGIVSSSTQTIENLPSGVISGSEQLPSGLVSSSTQTIENLPIGVISGSTQIGDLGFINSTVTSSMSVLNAETASIANSLKTGLDLVVNQITGSNASFISMSVGYLESITGSAKIIGDAFIILNNDTPTSRYAGLKVIDSGSSNNTSSFLYDGLNDNWFYEKDVSGTTKHGVTLFGPEYTTTGTPTYLTPGTLPKAEGNHNLVDSNIIDNGSEVKISTNTIITGSLLVSGSGISGSFSGSFEGDGSGLTNIDPSVLPSGVVSSSSQTIANLPSGTISSSTQLPSGIISGSTQLPSGIVSSSAQTIANFPSGVISGSEQLPSGIVSSSSQTIANLPLGTISSSTQLPSGIISGSEQLPLGIVSSSTQTIANLPSGVVSGSTQISDLGFVQSSITASSLETASVDLNEITFTKGDGSTFAVTVDTGSVPAGTISSSNQVDITLTTGYTAFSSSLATENQSLETLKADLTYVDSQDTVLNNLIINANNNTVLLVNNLSGSASTARDVLSGSLTVTDVAISSSVVTLTTNVNSISAALFSQLAAKASLADLAVESAAAAQATTDLSASASTARQEIIDGTVALNNIEITGSLSVNGNVEIDGGLFTTVITPSLQNAGFPFYTLDCSEGNFFEVTLPSNQTGIRPVPTNASPGQTINFKITQNSTTASTLNWTSVFNFADGFDSAVSTGLGDIDVFSLITYDGSNWFVTGLKNFS